MVYPDAVSLDSKTTVAVDRGTVLDLNRLAIDLERAEGHKFTLGDVVRWLLGQAGKQTGASNG